MTIRHRRTPRLWPKCGELSEAHTMTRTKAPTAKRAPRKQSIEDKHQIALVDWARHCRLPDDPHIEPDARLCDYLFHIPNGGKRGKIEAVIFKRMGTKAGVSDLFLPLPLHGNPGLWIEMKAPYRDSRDKNYPSKEQRAWLDRMKRAGYQTAVAYGWLQAREAIENYLKGKHHEQTTV